MKPAGRAGAPVRGKRRRSVRAPVDVERDRFSPLLDDEPVALAHSGYTVQTTVWRYKGMGGWHFAHLPEAVSTQIRAQSAATKRGWGSVPVRVRIGDTEWETSLFPDRKAKSYLFAIKAAVRKAEGIADGSKIKAQVSMR